MGTLGLEGWGKAPDERDMSISDPRLLGRRDRSRSRLLLNAALAGKISYLRLVHQIVTFSW